MRLPAAFALGFATAFFLDPRDGTRRRHVLRDRLLRLARRGRSSVSRRAKYSAGRARGVVAEARTAIGDADVATDDVTVKQRILSDALRDVQVKTSDVAVDVTNGVVTLRGALSSRTLADDLVARIRDVPGVRDVATAITVGDEAPLAD
jgi:osmotically-inducible protein OsmY